MSVYIIHIHISGLSFFFPAYNERTGSDYNPRGSNLSFYTICSPFYKASIIHLLNKSLLHNYPARHTLCCPAIASLVGNLELSRSQSNGRLQSQQRKEHPERPGDSKDLSIITELNGGQGEESSMG